MSELRSILHLSGASPSLSSAIAQEEAPAPAVPISHDGYGGTVDSQASSPSWLGSATSQGRGSSSATLAPPAPAPAGPAGSPGADRPLASAPTQTCAPLPVVELFARQGHQPSPRLPLRAFAPAPTTLLMEAPVKSWRPPLESVGATVAGATPAPPPGPAVPVAPPLDLGPGFPLVPGSTLTAAERLHDLLACHTPRLYALGVNEVLTSVSDATVRSVGLDVEGLLSTERRLYQVLAHSEQGYVGSSPPIFQALANGQAAYVNLGPGRETESDHLTRLFSNLPPEALQAFGPGHDDLAPVRQALLDRMAAHDFPAYVDVGGDLSRMSATESIATESIASIARRENTVGSDFPDPVQYFQWLVTRVDSAYRKIDPWLFAVDPAAHRHVDAMKSHLTSPWLLGDTTDPFGFTPRENNVQAAYQELMGLCGGGASPTFDDFTRFADSAVCLDRDLMTGIQTYWIKLLRELSREQRESVMAPLSRIWVGLNLVDPADPHFERVSPPNAPDIELVDKHTGHQIMERYDRAMALSEVVDHTLDGLGISERRQMIDSLLGEIRAHADAVHSREERVRALLGEGYSGLDVDGILSGRLDIRDPATRKAFDQLRQGLQPDVDAHPMTVERAEIQRHLDLLKWVACHHVRYGDVAAIMATRSPGFEKDPLILGEFFTEPQAPVEPTPLPPGPSQVEVLGKPVPGQSPLGMSVVLEGGGGKGFSFVECLKQTRAALEAASGQVAIDEYVGNSAGAITAGLLAGGYSPEELGQVLPQLDFKKFYCDYLWLMGGVDPKVRGVDRTGLFSQQKMYQTISGLLNQKLGVKGRPVLFRDLPFKLKVTATVLNADLPDDLKRQFAIGKDGQVVFSAQATPNMDVAAAICCSAAVPGFFNAPQIQVCRQEPDEAGDLHVASYRMQLFDGGSVNNFPIAEATRPESGDACLVALPSYYSAPSAHAGDPPVELSTLNFDQANMPLINAYNAGRYQQFAPQVATFLQKAHGAGVERAVVAFNLARPTDQPAPIVQGTSRAKSKELGHLAQQAGLPRMSVKKGARVIRDNFIHDKPWYLHQVSINGLLDKDDTFKPGFFHEPEYHPQQREAEGLPDLYMGVMAARMTTPYQLESKLFERS